MRMRELRLSSHAVKWPAADAEGHLRLREESIALQELLPIVLACAMWGRQWRNAQCLVHCDNRGVVELVNAGYSRVSQLMHMLRCLFFIRARFQMDVVVFHVPGVENTLADAISRNNLPLLFAQVPAAAYNRTEIPPQLVAMLVECQPDWTSRAWTRLFRSYCQLE